MLVCLKSADDLGAVQTDDGVYSGIDIAGRQLSCGVFRHQVFCFDGGHVDIIVDVGMAGRKVAGNDLDLKFLVPFRFNDYCACIHLRLPLSSLIWIYFTI